MHIHLPKPLHGWREFAGEVGIIVLGVLIALGLDQIADQMRWRRKVDQSEANMRVEVARDRTNAAEFSILAPCADAYMDRMVADLRAKNSADLSKLYAIGAPFVREAWTATAWDAAVASQIGDHMNATRFLDYAEAFRRAELMRDWQLRLRQDYVTAMVGRYGINDASAFATEITAADMLRNDMTVARNTAEHFIVNADALGIGPFPHRLAAYKAKGDACSRALGSPAVHAAE